MSMNQTAIMSFLNKPRNRVMLDTSYTRAFGKTPGRIATLMRHEPEIISGGIGLTGGTPKAKAHAAALRALVREKQVTVKVLHEKGSEPMVVITKKNTRTEDETVTEVPRKKRKYTKRKGVVVQAAPEPQKEQEQEKAPETPEAPQAPIPPAPAPEIPVTA